MKQLYIVLLSLAGLIAVNSAAVGQEGKQLPAFSFTDMKGKNISNTDIQSRSGMFMYFDPLCEVCAIEMKILKPHMRYFEDKSLILVSPGTPEDVQKFIQRYHLDKYPNITVIQDEKDTFYRLFQTNGYPSLVIFNEKNEITSNFAGETFFEEIETAFNPSVNINSGVSSVNYRSRATPLTGF